MCRNVPCPLLAVRQHPNGAIGKHILGAGAIVGVVVVGMAVGITDDGASLAGR